MAILARSANGSGQKDIIRAIINRKPGGANPDLVEDIIENALKLLSDLPHRGDVRVIQTAVRELRYAFRLFAPYAGIRKVTILGSARTQSNRAEYRQAVDLGRQLAAAGFMVITGAGPGTMQAGYEGAGPEKSFGVNIRLPWEQAPNPIIERDKKLINFKYFFTRKLIFMRHADEDFVDLLRIAFGFNRHDYGRLRQLIDVLNRL